MNDAYKPLLKGHQNSEEILRKLALPIEEKPDDEKLETLKICLAELDNKKTLEEAAKVAIDWAKEQKKNRSIKKGESSAPGDRPLPELVPQAGAIAQIPDIDGQPIDEEITAAWGAVANEEAQAVTGEYSGAPFDGIYEAASEASDPAKIEQLKNYGKSLFYGALQKEMSNPAMIAKVKEEMRKKHRRA